MITVSKLLILPLGDWQLHVMASLNVDSGFSQEETTFRLVRSDCPDDEPPDCQVAPQWIDDLDIVEAVYSELWDRINGEG